MEVMTSTRGSAEWCSARFSGRSSWTRCGGRQGGERGRLQVVDPRGAVLDQAKLGIGVSPGLALAVSGCRRFCMACLAIRPTVAEWLGADRSSGARRRAGQGSE
ncbi:hypothetical protein THIOKS1690002 [Thiocapsa sp. KS1]|nr:hypothetical protein THIOKS1690002 [Thiocapsa sp. KS1]